jgi:hypothetical protein
VTSKNKPKRSPVVAPNDERIPAAVDLIGRTGADEVQLRYSDDEKPVVWMAVARWRDHWEAAAAMTPARALFRLLDEVIDGGQCKHCNRPTGFSPDLDALPLDALICWYQWDPELQTFRRGCAGDG